MNRLEVDHEDPVAVRIARILEAKRRDNEEVLSALNVAEEAWERLNKEVDTAIGQEFDLLATERDAVLAAKDRLDNPDTSPSDQGFVFTGQVFERTTKAGLAQILVRVLRERDVTGDPLAEVVTDAAGRYRALVSAQQIDPGGAPAPIRIEALAARAGKPIGTDRRTVAMQVGGVEQVDLPVGRVRGVADRVSVAQAARDSIDETVASVERRLESMKSAHTATTRFSDLTRDGLRALSDAMATDPPPIASSVPIVGVGPVVQPPRNGDGGDRPPAPPAPPAPPVPPRSSTSLEEIEGIGPRLAERLRDAGIPDVETFVRTKFETLAKILGEERAKSALAIAEKLLDELER